MVAVGGLLFRSSRANVEMQEVPRESDIRVTVGSPRRHGFRLKHQE